MFYFKLQFDLNGFYIFSNNTMKPGGPGNIYFIRLYFCASFEGICVKLKPCYYSGTRKKTPCCHYCGLLEMNVIEKEIEDREFSDSSEVIEEAASRRRSSQSQRRVSSILRAEEVRQTLPPNFLCFYSPNYHEVCFLLTGRKLFVHSKLTRTPCTNFML